MTYDGKGVLRVLRESRLSIDKELSEELAYENLDNVHPEDVLMMLGFSDVESISPVTSRIGDPGELVKPFTTEPIISARLGKKRVVLSPAGHEYRVMVGREAQAAYREAVTSQGLFSRYLRDVVSIFQGMKVETSTSMKMAFHRAPGRVPEPVVIYMSERCPAAARILHIPFETAVTAAELAIQLPPGSLKDCAFEGQVAGLHYLGLQGTKGQESYALDAFGGPYNVSGRVVSTAARRFAPLLGFSESHGRGELLRFSSSNR